jgi:ATP-dependent Zn protease
VPRCIRNAGYERAHALLLDKKAAVEVVAQRLIERSQLTAAEFKQLIDIE